jgi:hypothetical protein
MSKSFDTYSKKKYLLNIYFIILFFVISSIGLMTYFLNIKPMIDSNFSIQYKIFYYILLGVIFVLSVGSVPYVLYNFLNELYGILVFKKTKKLLTNIASNIEFDEKKHTVAIVIPIFNDFEPISISDCLKQNYKNVKVYFLDDSTDKNIISSIDSFANTNNIRVIRKPSMIIDGKEFKYGLPAAFSYFLSQTKGEWDFMCHIDCGDIMDVNYLVNNIPLFFGIEKLGCLTSFNTQRNINNSFHKLLHP